MYRIIIHGAHATDRERIQFSCTFEHSTDGGETWAAIKGAPDGLQIPLTAVREALSAPGPDAAKRAALVELIRTTSRSLPRLMGLYTIRTLVSLLPGGWPVTVNL